MGPLIEIANKAIADYGFRQVVLWSPDDVVARWALSSDEVEVLRGPVFEALQAMPVPVEPRDVPSEQDRLAQIIGAALGRP